MKRRLFEGDEIAVIKNDNDWKLSLKNMLAGNLKYDKADSEKNSRAERILKGRADYNDYLELLLHSVSENIKNYRTMTAMELRIIDMGKTGFRMKDYIYEARIQVNVLPKAFRLSAAISGVPIKRIRIEVIPFLIVSVWEN